MRDLRGLLFERIGQALWAPRLPSWLRVAGLTSICRRRPGRGRLSRQFDLLAEAVAAAGAARLLADPTRMRADLADLVRHGAAPVLIVGDSHSRLWVQRGVDGQRWLLPLHQLATGASARGLANAQSRSGQGERLLALDRANAAGPRLPMLLVFGQVDVEFVQVFERLSHNPPMALDEDRASAFRRRVVASYVAFARALAGRLALAAIFPPALSDAAWRDGYINAHLAGAHSTMPLDVLRNRVVRAEIADLAARTAEHGCFNAELAAAAHGLSVLDPWPRLPMAAGSVSPDMLGRAGGRDHHLDAQAVRPYLAPDLWRLIDG